MSPLTFNCSACDHSLEVDPSMAGQLVDCPACGAALEIPTAAGIESKKRLASERSFLDSTACTNDLLKRILAETTETRRMVSLFYRLALWSLAIAALVLLIDIAVAVYRSF